MSVAVVTGASSGIGLATTLRLAAMGHEVYGSMRDLDRSGDLRDAVAAAGLDNVHLLRLDVDRDESVASAFDQVERQSGPVDILVNNAGISGSLTIEDMDVDLFAAMVNTNYLGTVRCVKAVLPTMRERGAGAIVNVTSIAARVVAPTMGAYAGSKWAVEGFSEALAQEVAADGIRVVVVEPGVVRTPIFDKRLSPPGDTAHGELYRRQRTYFLTALADPSEAEHVADAIAEALTTDRPRLRWVVGADAEARLAGRQAMTDERMVDIAAIADGDAWKQAWSEAYRFPLR